MAVLDTSFLIDLERNLETATSALDWLLGHEEPLLVPAQVAIEYLAGIDDPEAALHRINTSFVLVGVDQEQVLVAGRAARRALQAGLRPGWADLQVAALALLEAAVIVTADPGGFERLGCNVWEYRSRRAPTDPS